MWTASANFGKVCWSENSTTYSITQSRGSLLLWKHNAAPSYGVYINDNRRLNVLELARMYFVKMHSRPVKGVRWSSICTTYLARWKLTSGRRWWGYMLGKTSLAYRSTLLKKQSQAEICHWMPNNCVKRECHRPLLQDGDRVGNLLNFKIEVTFSGNQTKLFLFKLSSYIT